MRTSLVRILGASCAAASLVASSAWAQGLLNEATQPARKAVQGAPQVVPQAPQAPRVQVPAQPQPRVQAPVAPVQPQPKVQVPAQPQPQPKVQVPAQPQPKPQAPVALAQPQPKVQAPATPLPQPNVPKVNPVNPDRPKTDLPRKVAPKGNVDPNIDPKIKMKADPKIDPQINQKVNPNIDPKIAPKLDPKVGTNPKAVPDLKNRPNNRNPDGTNRNPDGTNRPGDAIQHTANSISKNGQALGGNQINLGNRTIVLANQGYRPAYQRHQRYYNGYWGGNYGYVWGGPGGGWNYGAYGYRPLGWGLGAWGLGAIAYNSGYLGYYNPYYSSAASSGGYNYAQPIAVAYDDTATTAGNNNGTSESILDSAVAAFKQNDYDQALDIVDKGISQYPTDAVLHEFRALVLFAREDYQQAAATVHSVLAVGPGWNWETMRSFYTDVAIYTKQLRALENFAKKNSDDAGSRFLLAYHYLAGGHQDAAARKLAEVVKLAPRDQVAADVLNMITASAAASTAAAPAPADNRQLPVGAAPQAATRQPAAAQPAEAPTPNAPPTAADQTATPAAKVDPATLIGTWNASRDDGSKFTLTLNDDKTFTWKFSQKDQKGQEFSGKYTIENNVLALQRDDGGSLVATVTPDGEKAFNFKLLGAPPQDPGLNFNH